MSRLGLLTLGFALAGLACATRPSESETDSRQREAARDEATPTGDKPSDMPAAEPTPDPLSELQRKLAANEAELRRLGVPIVAALGDGELREVAEAEPPADAIEARTTTGSAGQTSPAKDRGADKKATTTKKKSGKASPTEKSSKADAKPGMAPSPSADPSISQGIAGGSGGIQPDEAKSVQGPPVGNNEQAEPRCPLICSLADSTCELSDEICELADRHADEDDYSVACERANNDCEQAKEACRECPL